MECIHWLLKQAHVTVAYSSPVENKWIFDAFVYIAEWSTVYQLCLHPPPPPTTPLLLHESISQWVERECIMSWFIWMGGMLHWVGWPCLHFRAIDGENIFCIANFRENNQASKLAVHSVVVVVQSVESVTEKKRKKHRENVCVKIEVQLSSALWQSVHKSPAAELL